MILLNTGVYRLKNRRLDGALLLVSFLAVALVCSSSARPVFANAVVDKHNKVGTEAFKQARHVEAEKSFLLAIKAAEASGANSPDVAISLCNLAELYLEQGKYGKAESLYKRALAMYEKALGSNHCYFARVLDNLAVLYKDQGKYAEAEPMHKRALSILEKTLGPNDPDVASGLNNLGGLYKEQGKYAEAEPLFKRALAIDEKVLGPNHLKVATALSNLAELYWARSS